MKKLLRKLALKKLINLLVNYLNSNEMKDLKTTALGILGGLAIIFTQIGYALDADPGTELSFTAIVTALGLMGIGWFAKDKDSDQPVKK